VGSLVGKGVGACREWVRGGLLGAVGSGVGGAGSGTGSSGSGLTVGGESGVVGGWAPWWDP
jgi:hypothetical protein